MDLRQLKYFLRILECGSLTRAAAALHLSQPTLGEHMRKLEDELGVELFVRHSRGIAPTPAALLLRERAEHLLSYTAETRELVRASGAALVGSVTLGVSPGLNELFSADLIESCRTRLPGVVVNVIEDLSGALVERMGRGGDPLDVALVSGFDLDGSVGIAHTPLATEALYLVGRSSRVGAGEAPCAFTELAGYPLILLGSGERARPHGLRRLLQRVASARGIALEVKAELRSVAAVRELVERDAGVTVLPRPAVRQALAAGTLVARALADPPIARDIHLIEPAARNRGQTTGSSRPWSVPYSSPAAAVRALLQELVAARIGAGQGELQPLGAGPSTPPR